MGRCYPTLTAAAVRAREAALTRYSEFPVGAAAVLEPATAVATIGWLYDLLPPGSRERPVDPRGVVALHEALAVLGGRAW
jgi:hypothetical protein